MLNFSKLLKKYNHEKHKEGSNKLGKSKRETLIAEAIALHKKKSRLLESLDQETRDRLRAIAKNNVFNLPKKK